MKILYLKLENFATIYSGMGRKSIEIDFTKSKNKIVLLIGDNGTGKTAILSELHPFAYSGSMDVRSGSSVILPGKDGYKEIHIEYDDNLYMIKHYYKSNKEGALVKSFISKNGEELNVNGNVRSFNSLVKQELSVEQDYLKLLRLGSNVTNIIEMKAIERKNFTSQLLSDIDEYNKLYKKINDDTKVVKALLKSVSDKIYKLNVVDKKDTENQLKSMEETQLSYMRKKDELTERAGIIKGTVDASLGCDYSEFIDSIKTHESKKRAIEETFDNMQRQLIKYPMFITDDMEEYIDTIKTDIDRANNDLAVESSKLNILNQQLNLRYNERDDVNIHMRKLGSDVEYSRLNDHYVNLVKRYDDLKVVFGNNTPSLTKDLLLALVDACENINNLTGKIFEHSDSSIKEAIRLIRNHTDIDSYVAKEISKVDNKLVKVMSDAKIESKSNDVVVLFKPPGCPFDDCPYDVLYNKIFGKDEKKSEVSEKVLNNQRDELLSISSVGKNIDAIFIILKSYDSIINSARLPQFKIDNILDKISKIKYPMNESDLTKMISDVEDYNEFCNLKVEIKEVKAEIASYKERTALTDSLKQRLISIDLQITDITGQIESSVSTIKSRNKRLDDLVAKHEAAIEVHKIESQMRTLQKDLDETMQSIISKRNTLKMVESELERLDTINRDIETINWELDKIKSEILELSYTLREFETLSKEQDILNDRYEDLSTIKESLSPTKGIPLLFIQLYLKNSKEYVNELLSVVYGDNFEIDDFEITSTEFNIPYIKNGIRVDDVVRASQGERSFLSLALSFALLNQSVKDYNILLLDEIDATLDQRKRGLFLSILEKQMEVIDAEQVFLITHNNMFDSYPVDVIMTSEGHDVSDNQNVIFKAWK